MGYSVKLAKSATKDLKHLKGAHLDQKFKNLMEVLKENPFQDPPPYEKLIEYCEQIEPPVRMIEPASAINRATQCNRESH